MWPAGKQLYSWQWLQCYPSSAVHLITEKRTNTFAELHYRFSLIYKIGRYSTRMGICRYVTYSVPFRPSFVLCTDNFNFSQPISSSCVTLWMQYFHTHIVLLEQGCQLFLSCGAECWRRRATREQGSGGGVWSSAGKILRWWIFLTYKQVKQGFRTFNFELCY